MLGFTCFVFLLDFTIGPIRINPDRSHSKIKSKHENFNSKNLPDPLL
jgi:hypothetical protein